MSNRRLKPILYPASFLEKKLQSEKANNKPEASQSCLAKYFPKFYKALEIATKPNRKTFERIRQVKILHHLKMEYYMPEKQLVPIFRRFLQNKRKSLKSIPAYSEKSLERSMFLQKRSLELGMLLPRIKILDLSSKWNYGWEKSEMKPGTLRNKIWRFYKRFWKYFRHLEYVKMFEYDYDLPLLIRDLNKQIKTLPYLKTFIINFETNSWDHPKLSKSFKELFSSSFAYLKEEENFISFAPLLTSVLLSKSSAASCPHVRIETEEADRASVSLLQNEDTLTMKVLKPDIFFFYSRFLNSLEKISQTVAYCGRMPTQLRALEFQFYDITDEYAFNVDFLSSLLKETLTIQSLVLKFSFSHFGKIVYLSPILDTLSHFKSLKHLTVLDQSDFIKKKLSLDLNYSPETLSRLTSLNIHCLIQEASRFKDFLPVFLANQQEEPKDISISEITFPSFQSLAEFFETLNLSEELNEDNAYFIIHLPVNRIGDVLRDFSSCLSLRKRIPIELVIDSRAGGFVAADLSQKLMDQLKNTFPQFQVLNHPSSDIFVLTN